MRTLPTTTQDSLDLWLAEQEDKDWAFWLEATYVDPAERVTT